MTENLAGRGEGLAGLARELAWELAYPGEKRCAICSFALAESADKGCVIGNCSYRPFTGAAEDERVKRHRASLALAQTIIIAKLETALEAAARLPSVGQAPPSTAQRQVTSDCLDQLREMLDRKDLSDADLYALNEAITALATPSPQPPQCCCNVSWLDLDQRDCPIHGPAATQEQPAGSGAITVNAVTGPNGPFTVPDSLPGHAMTHQGHWVRGTQPGSPRKVGEDGARSQEWLNGYAQARSEYTLDMVAGQAKLDGVEQQPGLGSGALREALEAVRRELKEKRIDGVPMWDWISNGTDGLVENALSLSSPIEQGAEQLLNEFIGYISVEYEWRQERWEHCQTLAKLFLAALTPSRQGAAKDSGG